MLISIVDSDLKEKTQASGNDIVFTERDGKTKLDHEIESYNGITGELTAWIKIPSLSSISDTVIYMHYGNSDAENQQNIEGVWSYNYRGVWHLGEPSGNAKDSTSYGTNGSLIGGVTQEVQGQNGNGYEFDGVDGSVVMGDPPDGHLVGYPLMVFSQPGKWLYIKVDTVLIKLDISLIFLMMHRYELRQEFLMAQLIFPPLSFH
jgi:hypothetical protein